MSVIIVRYLGIQRRLIPKRPRTIHKSEGFLCPTQYLLSLAELERMIAIGNDLMPYISKRIENLNYADAMLNEWGVHHLHLGERKRINRNRNGCFVERTRELLFCYFTDSDAYFVGIFDHCDFLLQAVIEVIHENWPCLLGSFRMPHVHSLYPRLSEDQSREIRLSKSFMSLTEMRDDTVYFPPGGGVATSGDNLRDVMKTDRMLRMLTEMQVSIVQFIEDERDTADAPPHSSPVNLRLFDLGKETCSVKDESNGHIYQCRRSGSDAQPSWRTVRVATIRYQW